MRAGTSQKSPKNRGSRYFERWTTNLCRDLKWTETIDFPWHLIWLSSSHIQDFAEIHSWCDFPPNQGYPMRRVKFGVKDKSSFYSSKRATSLRSRSGSSNFVARMRSAIVWRRMTHSKKQNPCQTTFLLGLAKIMDFASKSLSFARSQGKFDWHGFCFLDWFILSRKRQTIKFNTTWSRRSFAPAARSST